MIFANFTLYFLLAFFKYDFNTKEAVYHHKSAS